MMTPGLDARSRTSSQCSRRFLGENLSQSGLPATRGALTVAVILYKSITGAGALAMPKAMRDSGILIFIAGVLGVAMLSHYGCVLLSRSLDIVGRQDVDIADLGNRALGWFGFLVAMACCFLDSWGAAIAMLRMLAELFHPMLRDAVGSDTRWTDEWVIIVVLSLVVFPMMLYRKITQLAWINLVGIGAMVAFVVCIGFKAALSHNTLVGRPLANWDNASLVALPVIAFSYDCQVNIFGSYRDLNRPVGRKTKSIQLASLLANGGAALSYIAIALCGYISYLDDTEDDILNNLPTSYTAVKVLFGISVLFTFPVILIECSTILREYLITWLLYSKNGVYQIPEEERQEWIAIAGTNLLIIMSGAAVAAFVPGMYAAFSYVGATTATANTSILPPLFYLGTVRAYYPEASIFSPCKCKSDEEEPLLVNPNDDVDDERFLREGALPPAPSHASQYFALAYLISGLCAMGFFLFVTVKLQ